MRRTKQYKQDEKDDRQNGIRVHVEIEKNNIKVTHMYLLTGTMIKKNPQDFIFPLHL